MSEPSLTLLYDGACPLCLREVKFLKGRDLHGRLAFVDIDQDTYDPSQWKGIGYRERALVASSNSITAGLPSTALAMAMRWSCPPETLVPRS